MMMMLHVASVGVLATFQQTLMEQAQELQSFPGLFWIPLETDPEDRSKMVQKNVEVDWKDGKVIAMAAKLVTRLEDDLLKASFRNANQVRAEREFAMGLLEALLEIAPVEISTGVLETVVERVFELRKRLGCLHWCPLKRPAPKRYGLVPASELQVFIDKIRIGNVVEFENALRKAENGFEMLGREVGSMEINRLIELANARLDKWWSNPQTLFMENDGTEILPFEPAKAAWWLELARNRLFELKQRNMNGRKQAEGGQRPATPSTRCSTPANQAETRSPTESVIRNVGTPPVGDWAPVHPIDYLNWQPEHRFSYDERAMPLEEEKVRQYVGTNLLSSLGERTGQRNWE